MERMSFSISASLLGFGVKDSPGSLLCTFIIFMRKKKR
jgi:hypothetical protein